MGKVKISKKEKKEKKEEAAAAAPPAAPDSPGKRKHRRHHDDSKYRTYLKRICKAQSIPKANADAAKILDAAANGFLSGLIRHMGSLLNGTTKMVTQKTVRTAFIGYLEQQKAQDELIQGGIQRAEASIKALEESFA